MTNYLEVTNLSKSFDSFQLHNISFTLPKGYIMGLIGPNGSGKTTTIKLILNMLKRTGGTVKVMGLDNIAEEQKVKSELGVVFDTNYFSDDWKVSQVEKSRNLGDTVPLDSRFNYAVSDWWSAGVCYQCADALCGTKIV